MMPPNQRLKNMKTKIAVQRKMTRFDHVFAVAVTLFACAIILTGVFTRHLMLIFVGFTLIPSSLILREAWLRTHDTKSD